jgi:hypothetical protein
LNWQSQARSLSLTFLIEHGERFGLNVEPQAHHPAAPFSGTVMLPLNDFTPILWSCAKALNNPALATKTDRLLSVVTIL